MSGALASMWLSDGGVSGQIEVAATQAWVVPFGVTSICVACIGAPIPYGTAPQHATLKRGGTTLLSSGSTLGGSIGGGNGGAGGSALTVSYPNPQPGEFARYDHRYFSGGGGGAGGYTGNGGAGAAARMGASANGGNGSGGGGGGGTGDALGGDVPSGDYFFNYDAADGGGVGLRGAGSSGAGGSSSGAAGGRGSYNNVGQPTPGAGAKGARGNSISLSGNFPDSTKQAAATGDTGGNLRYLNNIAVTAGESLTLTVPAGGGIRIMWGPGRSYPSDAADR